MRFDFKLTVGTVAITALFCAAAGCGIAELNRQKDSRAWVSHTINVVSQLNSLRCSVKSVALSAERVGVYGSDGNIESYVQAKKKVVPLLTLAQHLVIDERAQSERIAVVAGEYVNLVHVLDSAIYASPSKEGYVTGVIKSAEFKKSYDSAVKETNDAIKTEEDLLMQRTMAFDLENQNVIAAILVIAAIAIAALSAQSFLISKLFREKSKAEEDMEADRLRLVASENKFRQMAGSVRECFFMTDNTGVNATYISPAFEQIFGYSFQVHKARPNLFVECLHPEDRDRVVALIQEQRQTKSPESMEYRIIRADGETRWLLTRMSRLFDENDQIIGLCGVTSDITERMAADLRIREFYSMVSHELRTPLTSIKGSLRLLEGGRAGTLSPRALELIKIGRAESDRLIRLINDILDLKKIEAGKFELNEESINPGSLVRKVLNAMTVAAAEQKISLDLDISCDETFVGDEEKLTQVLTNLVSNAIKYSNENEKVMVAVTRRSAQELRFSVTDQGAGIPEAQMHKLFNKFQQLDSTDSRKRGGTGLGLAISKAIVECHEGKIGVDSSIGKGSTFWFDLPTKLAS